MTRCIEATVGFPARPRLAGDTAQVLEALTAYEPLSRKLPVTNVESED